MTHRNDRESPPELTDIFKNSFNSPTSPFSFLSVFCLVFFIVVGLTHGVFILRESERAVITRLGQIHAFASPGLNWCIPLVDRVHLVNIDEINSFHKQHMMLTADEKIVDVSFAFQYKKNDIVDYLFKDEYPVRTLEELAESSIRFVIGHSKLDDILTTGKQKITENIRQLIHTTLPLYTIGLELVDVNLIFARPPVAVQEYFNDVIRAREDEQAYKNEAERYQKSELPIANGQAQGIRYAAQAERESRLNQAKGAVQRFLATEKEYVKSPDIMHKRLYLEAMESILSSTHKVIVDPGLGQNFFVLPSSSAEGMALSVTQPPSVSREQPAPLKTTGELS